MPIRFRCPVCDGLLSTARRKAGLQVRCPKCGDDVTVPDADLAAGDYDAADDVEPSVTDSGIAAPVTAPAAAKALADVPLFERTDIDRLLGTDRVAGTSTATAEAPAAAPTATPAAVVHPAEDGVYVSRSTLVVAGLLVFVLLALSFATGLLVGH